MLTRSPAWNSPLGQISAEMDRLLDSVFPTLTAPMVAPARRAFPALNVWEDSDSFTLEAEIPGIPRDRLDLSVQGDTLLISGQRTGPASESEGLLRHERWHGKFERSVTLPSPIDAESVRATLTDGVLTITINKQPQARPRKIEVQNESR